MGYSIEASTAVVLLSLAASTIAAPVRGPFNPLQGHSLSLDKYSSTPASTSSFSGVHFNVLSTRVPSPVVEGSQIPASEADESRHVSRRVPPINSVLNFISPTSVETVVATVTASADTTVIAPTKTSTTTMTVLASAEIIPIVTSTMTPAQLAELELGGEEAIGVEADYYFQEYLEAEKKRQEEKKGAEQMQKRDPKRMKKENRKELIWPGMTTEQREAIDRRISELAADRWRNGIPVKASDFDIITYGKHGEKITLHPVSHTVEQEMEHKIDKEREAKQQQKKEKEEQDLEATIKEQEKHWWREEQMAKMKDLEKDKKSKRKETTKNWIYGKRAIKSGDLQYAGNMDNPEVRLIHHLALERFKSKLIAAGKPWDSDLVPADAEELYEYFSIHPITELSPTVKEARDKAVRQRNSVESRRAAVRIKELDETVGRAKKEAIDEANAESASHLTGSRHRVETNTKVKRTAGKQSAEKGNNDYPKDHNDDDEEQIAAKVKEYFEEKMAGARERHRLALEKMSKSHRNATDRAHKTLQDLKKHAGGKGPKAANKVKRDSENRPQMENLPSLEDATQMPKIAEYEKKLAATHSEKIEPTEDETIIALRDAAQHWKELGIRTRSTSSQDKPPEIEQNEQQKVETWQDLILKKFRDDFKMALKEVKKARRKEEQKEQDKKRKALKEAGRKQWEADDKAARVAWNADKNKPGAVKWTWFDRLVTGMDYPPSYAKKKTPGDYASHCDSKSSFDDPFCK